MDVVQLRVAVSSTSNSTSYVAATTPEDAAAKPTTEDRGGSEVLLSGRSTDDGATSHVDVEDQVEGDDADADEELNIIEKLKVRMDNCYDCHGCKGFIKFRLFF